MPKPYTFPTLYDEALQINISKLKEWGYLKPEQIKSGTLTWSRNGNETGKISIRVNTLSNQPYIELDYNFRNEPRYYKVKLVSVSSNLGNGLIWYFLCPKTNKRCRKLYSIDGYFLHREAFQGCLYESQIKSKYAQKIDETLGAFFKSDELHGQLYQKYFKKTYAGKPTKRYLKIMQQIEKVENISYSEMKSTIRNTR